MKRELASDEKWRVGYKFGKVLGLKSCVGRRGKTEAL